MNYSIYSMERPIMNPCETTRLPSPLQGCLLTLAKLQKYLGARNSFSKTVPGTGRLRVLVIGCSMLDIEVTKVEALARKIVNEDNDLLRIAGFKDLAFEHIINN